MLVRLFALTVWTSVIYLAWLVSRLSGLVSTPLAQSSHHALVGAWARGMAWILGISIEARGEPPPAPFFLVANHLSYVDIVVLLTRVPALFLAKSEIAGWPVLGHLARTTGTLFVDRTRKSDLPRVIRAVRGRLNEGYGVVVFPEGTSTDGSQVLPFKPSIFEVPARMELPVSYASLSYVTPSGGPGADLAVCWWGDMGFAGHFLELLALPSFRALVSFGPDPIVAGDRKTLALEAHRAVNSLFVPVGPP